MKKKISKRFLTLTVSGFLLIATAVVLACAGGDGDYSDFVKSFFAPETSHSSESKPFFRSQHSFYKTSDIYNTVNIMDSTNLKEWQQFFDEKASLSDLDYLVYKSRIGEIDTCIFFIKDNKHQIASVLKNNSVMMYHDKIVVKDFLFYLGYAKRCEPYATFSRNWWNDDEVDPRTDSTAMQKLIVNGESAMNRSKSPYLKERYAFQILRLFYQAGLYRECIDFYQQTQNLFISKNSIRYRAMGYVAASHYRSDENNSISNYLYSIIFDQCEVMRLICLKSFQPEEEADWEATLSLTKNTREKEVLWQMLGISYDPVRAMKEIYYLNPKSELLDLLLMRAVNINEELFIRNNNLFWWNTEEDTTFALCPEKVDTTLLSFSKSVANARITLKPYLWNLATGYLLLAQGNYTESEMYLKRAQSDCFNDKLVGEQIRILRLVSIVESYNTPNSTIEDKLATELTWLQKEKHHSDLRTHSVYYWAISRLGEKYWIWGDSIKATCLGNKHTNSFFDEIANIEAMIAFVDKPDKSNFEKYLSDYQYRSTGDLYTYISILLTYQNQFEAALEMLQKHQGTWNEGFPADPFVVRIKDCNDCDYRLKMPVYISRVSFLKRIVDLHSEAEKNQAKAAQNYFLIANGLYNISGFGNVHQYYERFPSSKAISLQYSWWRDKPLTDNPFLDCTKALEYYHKAMEASTDPEFKAKCCFMAAKCEQNLYYISGKFTYKNSIRSGEYFKLLRDHYSRTQYYQEVIEECGYFGKFLGMNEMNK
jgi:hypothetical protein